MFDDPVEDEVLYFLGGFSPREDRVGRQLWKAYRDTDEERLVRRRNLLVAYLHTAPAHSGRRIENVDAFDAEFGRLRFARTTLREVTWREVAMSRVELVKASWSGVRFEGSQLGEALIEGGRLELRFDGSTVDSLDCERAEATVEGDESTIDLWDLERATIRCTAGRELVVKELLMRASTLTLEEGDGHRAVPSVFGRAKVADSCLKVLGSVAPRILEAVGSLIVYGATENVAGDWRLS